MKVPPPMQLRGRGGFSLIEVLLATFILAIGLIMVATIFPVGAEWTRQATEASMARTIADNALNLIRERYSSSGPQAGQASSITTTLQGLPGLTAIPISERTYQFGNTNPYPALNPAGCTYFWTALARISPSSAGGISNTYDIYILVFRKGEAGQTFYAGSYAAPSGYSEVPGVRDTSNPANTTPSMDYHLEPTLITGAYSAGNYDATLDPPVAGAVPPIGFYGIGTKSGTVFRQVTAIDVNNSSNTKAQGRPNPAAGDGVIYAPPADGTTASPLVYVFQTTLTF